MPDLVRVHVDTWRATYTELLPIGFINDEFVAGRERMWTSIIGKPRPGLVVRVAERGGRVVGFAVAGDPDSDDAPRALQLYSIYLEPGQQGSGAGQALLDSVLGEHRAFLWVADHNPRARAFYERNGFQVDGTWQVDEAMPDLVELRMVR